MKTILMTLLVQLLLPLHLHAADAFGFKCSNYYPVQVQGDERFANLRFLEDGTAKLDFADLTSPFVSMGEFLAAGRVFYTHAESTAYAEWKDQNGKVAVYISLVYLGSFWGGVLKFEEEVKLPSFITAKGSEIDLKCLEAP